MAEILALVAILLTLAIAALLWRTGRRVAAGGDLEGIAVSRQWLVQHQGDDRP